MSSKVHIPGKLGYQEYAQIPNDGQRHEIVGGQHIVNPAPYTYHQKLSGRIHFQLYSQIEQRELGEVYSAPTDLQLSEIDIVQPDLIVVLERHRKIITQAKIDGTPDLVVEILSPSTVHYDRKKKKDLYLRSGVPEYWIVDPDRHVVEQFVLKAGVYEHFGNQADSIVPQCLPDVCVDLSVVW